MKDLGVAALALLFNDKGEVLSITREGRTNDLGLPGGKVELGETVYEGMKRELKEETGLDAIGFELIFHRNGRDHTVFTFLVRTWGGEPKDVEGKVVKWVKQEDLCTDTCTFQEYNRNLFTMLEKRKPK